MICIANQWTGFYVLGKKILRNFFSNGLSTNCGIVNWNWNCFYEIRIKTRICLETDLILPYDYLCTLLVRKKAFSVIHQVLKCSASASRNTFFVIRLQISMDITSPEQWLLERWAEFNSGMARLSVLCKIYFCESPSHFQI